MGTEITTAKPTTKQQALNLMRPKIERCDSRGFAEHQAQVAYELEVVSNKIDRFGWDRMEEDMKDRLTEDWMQALGQFDLGEIKAACSVLLSKKPKDATNEHQVKNEITAARARMLARLPNELESPEQERAAPSPAEKARVAAVLDEYLDKRKMHKPAPIWEPSDFGAKGDD